MKTLMITLGLVAFGLATSEAQNGPHYGQQPPSGPGEYFAKGGGGGGGGGGNGQGKRFRKRGGEGGGKCEDGQCEGGKGKGKGKGCDKCGK